MHAQCPLHHHPTNRKLINKYTGPKPCVNFFTEFVRNIVRLVRCLMIYAKRAQ